MHVEDEPRGTFNGAALRSPLGREVGPARTDARRATAWRSRERKHLRDAFLGSAFCGLALAVAAYGLGEGRLAVAAFGVAGFVLVASAMAVAACTSIRTLQRRCERLGR